MKQEEMNITALIIKSFSGMLFLLCAIGATLFVSYGGLNYDLAWLYLAVFTVSVVIITLYLFLFDKHLLQSRIAVGPIAETRLIQKIIQSIAGVAFLGIFVLSAFDYRNKWTHVPLEFSYASDLFCAGAFAWVYFVFKQNTFLSATIEVQEKQQVISTGLYGIVRHPMYTGVLILLVFTPIALGSYYGLFFVLILAVVIAYRSIDEEKVLKENLTGYEEYCKKVKYRLIPLVF